ncbi:virulence factor [Paraburkholderia sp. A2WS-5]|uniref:virulence factor n=1 Tax=unclassified Paraburkholderia TaxID=2615204 RepID=UPI003B762811
MSALIATWPRRVALAFCALFLSAVVMLVWMAHDNLEPLDTGEFMKRLLLLPGLVAWATFVLSTVLMPVTAQTATPSAEAAAATSESSRPFRAQVVGVQWLNPLQRRDYPTEWQLLWMLGLVKPNKNDDMVRTNPQKYSTLQYVAGIAYGNDGTETFKGFYHKYVDSLLPLFGTRYVMNSGYFYTVKPENKKDWRELAGIHVEFAIPTRLDPVEAQTYLQKQIISEFNIGNKYFPKLWSDSTPPEVRVTPGGPNAGFTSLNAALDYLQTNPDKSVWVMNWDAPSFPPKDGQLNENMVLLILTGPDFKTEREPLAWIGRAATGNASDFDSKAGTTRTVQAWKATIEAAAHNTGVTVPDIHYVIHDAGRASDEASARVGPLARTLTETLPDFDYGKQMFNTPALLGEMGAGTALTDVALAIGRANHLGGNVLVAGTTDANRPVAVVIVPPSKLNPIDADSDWFRARGGNNAYLPWWGHRFDEDKGLKQGYSE